MNFEVHVSDIGGYLRCRRLWDWSSLLRQGLEPKVPYGPFFTGRAIHSCLQNYYEYNADPTTTLGSFVVKELNKFREAGRLWPQEEEMLHEQVELMEGMLSHYMLWVEHYQGMWSDDKFEFISLETEFNVPLFTPSGRASPRVRHSGRFDGIVKRKDDGTFWVWEVKTSARPSGLIQTLDNDLQAGAYILAAEKLLGHPVQGVVYNILRKKVPTSPRVLKNGTLSNNKSIDTTVWAFIRDAKEWYKKELREEAKDSQVNPDDLELLINEEANAMMMYNHKDLMQTLMEQEQKFFIRTAIYRTRNELRQLERDLHYVALEMVRPTTRIYANPSWTNCRNCHFKAPCLAMNAGADFGFILQEEYRSRMAWQALEGAE